MRNTVYKRYYICNVFEKLEDHTWRFIEQRKWDGKKRQDAIAYMKQKKQEGYEAQVWPRVEEVPAD